jgi:hypothetical protein
MTTAKTILTTVSRSMLLTVAVLDEPVIRKDEIFG